MDLDHLKRRLRKKDNLSVYQSKETISESDDWNEKIKTAESIIKITRDGAFTIVEITRDCSGVEYILAIQNKAPDLEDKVDFSNFYDSNNDKFRAKKIFVYEEDNYLYNFCIDGNEICINEKICEADSNGNIDERIININLVTGAFLIHEICYEGRSTYFDKFYPIPDVQFKKFELEKDVAINLVYEVISKVRTIEGIDRLLPIDAIVKCISDNMNVHLNQDNAQMGSVKSLVK